MTVDPLWQFDLVWALADLHLSALVDDDFVWEPAELVWTMHRDLAARWRALLGTVDPAAPSSYPWGSELTFTHTALWVNVELTKNISEIGQLRLMRAAGVRP